eukprot:jgi/Chrzof1/11658/Cz06g04030.t1
MFVLSKVELGLYLALVLYFLQVLFRHGFDFCARLQQHHIAVPGVSSGWVPGHQQDLSDSQWRDFRGSMPLLGTVLAGFVVLSRAVQIVAPQHRVVFYCSVALVFLGALHGACLIYVVGLALVNYYLCQLLTGRPHGLLVIWAWNCGIFLLVRLHEGWPFAMISPSLAFLDQHRGLLRWHIHYNLLLLRMLSFAADLHWMRIRRPPRTRLPPDTPPHPDLDLKARTELPLEPGCYNLLTYLAYTLYPPLYIAGPIAPYNSFASQLQAPSTKLTLQSISLYAARAMFCLLTLEFVTHTLWFNAVAKHRLWASLAVAQGGVLSALDMTLVPWWVMLFVWLKFLVIWRFFRFFALADGMDVPENMTRCICNNYDIVGFWKNWHASYNQWLVRYMYIPLGGAGWRLLNVWPIFTFVAVWHDLEWRLMSWAWLMALLVAPEMLVKWIGAQAWCVKDKSGRVYRYLQAAAAACNIILLMAANMVGFIFGLDGIKPFLGQILGQPSFLPVVLLALFCGAQLMFALRDHDAAKQRQKEVLASKA